jgi:NAD(P)-dependent dehydrogenase (short-subunit alcohol dehydrogenase family)
MKREEAMFARLEVVVTGGGSGIGRALCEALAQRGARVAVADLLVETAREVAERIGNGARAYACDVSDRTQVQALAHAVAADFGGADMVFANAGVALAGKLCDTDPREFAWLFDVNVGGVFHTAQAFMPMLLASADSGRPARIIITGSENSVGLPLSGPSSAYTATKHALLGMADALQRDLAEDSVAVSIFCPSLVATRVWDARRARPERYGGPSAMPEDYANFADKSLKQFGMRPEDTVAQVIAAIERGEHLIITDPRIRQITTPRAAAVEAALATCDAAVQRGDRN